MSWMDILKNYEPTVSEVNLLAGRHALIDVYESKLVSEEEYKGYSDADKKKYHNRMYQFLKKEKDSDDADKLQPNKSFHMRMLNILRGASLKRETFSNLENEPENNPRILGNSSSLNRPKKVINIIDNYFEMYKNSGRSKPTLEDIEQGEGRFLSVDEKEYYYTKIAERLV